MAAGQQTQHRALDRHEPEKNLAGKFIHMYTCINNFCQVLKIFSATLWREN
jgi:hypothetical protein